MSVDFDQYWDKLIDYYYDHVRCYPLLMEPALASKVGIHGWIKEAYGASVVFRPKRKIQFDSPEQYSLCVLRWS